MEISRAHIAYYNPAEIDRMYVEHVSDKVELEETEGKKVTAGVLGYLISVFGKATGKYTQETVKEVPDDSLKQAVDLVREFLDNRDDIPSLGKLPDTESNYYKYSGNVTIDAHGFQNSDQNTTVEVYGEDNGTNFYAYTTFSNWIDGDSNSLLLHADSPGGKDYTITGLAYPINNSPDERGYPVKFTVIYI